MRTSTLPPKADLAVVGAGIVGLAHAYDAALRGLRVVVVDRDDHAVGASVRNFGHGIASGLAGTPAHPVARVARERWLALGRAAGFSVDEAGTLLLARRDDEVAAIEAFAATWPELARVVGPDEALALAPVSRDGVLGALHAHGDLRVDSERAVAAIAAHLEQDHDVAFRWATSVRSVEPGVLHTSSGTIHADAIVVCPGTELPEFVQRDGLTRCRLQMLEIDPPEGRRYRPALMTGLSLLRYPGFDALPETAAVRARLERERPDLLAHGIHLIVAQRPDGGLVIGDTHAYGHSVPPFRDEALDDLLLAEARVVLGADDLRVRRRWTGVYPSAPGGPFLVHAPCDGVRVVSLISGVGMTTALGLAPGVLDGLLEGRPGAQPNVEDAVYATPDRGSTSTCSVIENASPR